MKTVVRKPNPKSYASVSYGASPQLECWDCGIMGSGIIQCGVDCKICVDDKMKLELYLYKPEFQYSTIPAFHGWDQNP